MIGSTPLPSTGGGSGPAYDDTAVRGRLDVLEANRSASTGVRPELRSRLGALTLDSSFNDLVPNAGYVHLIVENVEKGISMFLSGGTVQQNIQNIVGFGGGPGYLEALVEDGHFVIRPSDTTDYLSIRSSAPEGVVEAFQIDDTWFGQRVYPRPAGNFDTTSTNVRLVGPEGSYAPGSGLSVSTALEALKRLHHAGDTVVEDRQFWTVPDEFDPASVTLGQIGAQLGQTARLSWASQQNEGVYGDPITVDDLDETVVSFLGRIPGVGFAYADRNGSGRNVIAFYTSGVPWQLTTPNRDGYGYVRMEFEGFAGVYPRIRRLLTRLHSDDLYVYTSFADAGSPFFEATSGQLSTVLGSVMTELRWLRKRVSDLEARP